MISCFDFHLGIVHLLIFLHHQLYLVSVQRTEDETQPECTEDIFTGKFYSELIVKNSMLKQIYMSLTNSLALSTDQVNSLQLIRENSWSFHSVDMISLLLCHHHHPCHHHHHRQQDLIIGNIIYSITIPAWFLSVREILLGSMPVLHC